MEELKLEKLAPEFLISRLQQPKPGCRVVIDTDTYNELDDPYALIYAFRSKELNVEAVYAAPFHNSRSEGPKDGMERSYDQILHILDLLGEERPAFKGSDRWMTSFEDPVDSPAARDLIDRAMGSDEPLYVATIGAPTNVASAILMEPKIREKIVVVWLGGHALHMPKTDEFNMKQDWYASRVILDSGVPLVILPCLGVVSHLTVTLPELKEQLSGKGPWADFLYENTEDQMGKGALYARVIWDISTIGWLCGVPGYQSGIVPCPRLSAEFTYSQDIRRHPIRYVNYIDRNGIFKDMFAKM